MTLKRHFRHITYLVYFHLVSLRLHFLDHVSTLYKLILVNVVVLGSGANPISSSTISAVTFHPLNEQTGDLLVLVRSDNLVWANRLGTSIFVSRLLLKVKNLEKTFRIAQNQCFLSVAYLDDLHASVLAFDVRLKCAHFLLFQLFSFKVDFQSPVIDPTHAIGSHQREYLTLNMRPYTQYLNLTELLKCYLLKNDPFLFCKLDQTNQNQAIT